MEQPDETSKGGKKLLASDFSDVLKRFVEM